MKTICPFCQKELSRIERLKYHLQHSVCCSDIEEKEEIISWLNMSVSTMLEKILNFMRKHKEILSENSDIKEQNTVLKEQIKVMTEQYSLLKRNNDALFISKEQTNDTKDDTSKHIVNTTSNTNTANTNTDNSIHTSNTNSHNTNTANNINNSKNITINLFGHENVDYIHVPNYLTDKYDIVKLVHDVHFNKNHPENHNVGMNDTIATIYRKHLLNKKIQWDNRFTKDEALSELIQNGENILSSYDKPLTLLQRDVLNVVTKIVEEETNWNCLNHYTNFFKHWNSHPNKSLLSRSKYNKK